MRRPHPTPPAARTRSPAPARALRALVLAAAVLSTAACGDDPGARWEGTVDTLASGQVVVSNPGTPLWPEGREWRLVEELRIGTLEGSGPDLFGRIWSLDVDDDGRIYVLEPQAREVRVFGPDGGHVRTIGRPGAGPGEFAEPVLAELGPDGRLWVTDPENNRVSVFDTAGTYLEGHDAPGGFVIIPWAGGFDGAGHYYFPIPDFSAGDFRMRLAMYDSAMAPVDTLSPPIDPVERDRFELRGGGNVMAASVPFSAGFRWRLSPSGTFWGLFTGDYRLFEMTADGDTIRTITRDFTALPVTDADRDEAREQLEWFVEQGGEVDWSKLPSRKPAADAFVLDPAGRIWVWPVTEGESGSVLDVFDADGRYLGRVRAPVPISPHPDPVFHDDGMTAVTRSDLEVPYVVRLRIQRPGEVGEG